MEAPLRHEDAAELTGLYVLGSLTGAERAAFEAHLAVCERCAAEVKAFEPVVLALAQLPAAVDPSPAVRARIVSGLRAESDVPASVRRVERRSGVPAWLALAAAVVVAVGSAFYAMQLRRQAASSQTMEAILAAPDLARIDLAGQPAAPSATARALWSRQRGLVFTASNLPALPAGRVYQLWVLSKEPAPMSAGLMKPDASGRVTFTIKTPTDMPQPVAMAVTLEPDGGVPAPTGDKYLVGLAN